MKKPQHTSRATSPHATVTTGRDGAKVETSSAERLMLEMSPGELKSIDAWIKTQPAPPQQHSKKAAAKARDMASQELDRLGDASLPADERERRKRRLTRGPVSFAICAATCPSRRAERTGLVDCPVCAENSDSAMLVMKAAQNWP
jgi:hypothetical protein